MSFDRITGQERAKAQAAAWLSAARIPHAILVSGPEGAGKRHLALELAKAVSCRQGRLDPCDQCSSCRKIDALIHPDVHTLLPLPAGSAKLDPARVLTVIREAALAYLRQDGPGSGGGANIPREHIRIVQREMAYAPTEAPHRIATVFDADYMHPAGANSLLKILEEPPVHALFILTSAHPDRLLPTVLSRCQRLHLRPLTKDELRREILAAGIDASRAERAARLGAGSLHRARQVLDKEEEFEERRQLVERFLDGGFSGEDTEYWTVLEELGGRPDRERLEDFLGLCGVYLRDLFLMAEQRPDDVVNTDRSARTEEWLQQILPGRIEAAALEVDRAFQHLSHNVNAQLVLAEFWCQLRLCRRTRAASPSTFARS